MDAAIDPSQRARAAESTRRHLDLALQMLAPRGMGTLVLVGGIVGTGKSTAAAELAEALGGVVIASDRVRKRQANLAPTAHASAGLDSGLYDPTRRERVYAGLLERAAPVLASGRSALLDATCVARCRPRARPGLRARARRARVLRGDALRRLRCTRTPGAARSRRRGCLRRGAGVSRAKRCALRAAAGMARCGAARGTDGPTRTGGSTCARSHAELDELALIATRGASRAARRAGGCRALPHLRLHSARRRVAERAALRGCWHLSCTW